PVVDAMPTSALRRLCRGSGYADPARGCWSVRVNPRRFLGIVQGVVGPSTTCPQEWRNDGQTDQQGRRGTSAGTAGSVRGGVQVGVAGSGFHALVGGQSDAADGALEPLARR